MQDFSGQKPEALIERIIKIATNENDIVLEVFNKGYTLKGRVIRPAKVKVNKID